MSAAAKAVPVEDLEGRLLAAVGGAGVSDSEAFAEAVGVDHETVVGLMKSLEAEKYVVGTAIPRTRVVLTDEAKSFLVDGSPEIQFIRKMTGPLDDAGINALFADPAFAVRGKGKAMQKKWIVRDKATGLYTKTITEEPTDELVEVLRGVEAGTVTDAKVLKDLEKQGAVTVRKYTAWAVGKAEAWAPIRKRLPADITKEMLDSGEWETATFKEYNCGDSAGSLVGGGHEHALMKVRGEFRQILLEMGFGEMPTNRFVESSFWNFDALFQPQSHPTRDMHDTFFLTTPAKTLTIEEGYLTAVRKVHEEGGWGSIGYRYPWKREEAEKNLLRTHTTAVSARMLHALANQPGGFKPAKYFSIDRVFRNEALDATHLAEFHQVEGVVADYDLSLGDLIGIISEFFKRIGITDLRFKPAFNPYTEPSMEIFGYHPDLKKWTEIGNSGIFRPEMLRPMGLPDGVRVIAWGLSLERPTMIKYRVKNIRDLFGHKVKFEMARDHPIARF